MNPSDQLGESSEECWDPLTVEPTIPRETRDLFVRMQCLDSPMVLPILRHLSGGEGKSVIWVKQKR